MFVCCFFFVALSSIYNVHRCVRLQRQLRHAYNIAVVYNSQHSPDAITCEVELNKPLRNVEVVRALLEEQPVARWVLDEKRNVVNRPKAAVSAAEISRGAK